MVILAVVAVAVQTVESEKATSATEHLSKMYYFIKVVVKDLNHLINRFLVNSND